MYIPNIFSNYRTTSNLSKNKRCSTEIETSNASYSPIPQKKNRNVQPETLTESLTGNFESFIKKQVDSTVPDRIGSFMLYLESEMRVLPNEAVKMLIRKITESLMQVQDKH